jgi:metal-responsive CopG/Arc/MetJ family transcriptional regulator
MSIKIFKKLRKILDKGYTFYHTNYMKTAIYIDQELFDKAEKFSYAAEMSRSKLYCTAINEYIQNHEPDIIIEKLNSYYSNHESRLDDDLKAVAYRAFDKEDW